MVKQVIATKGHEEVVVGQEDTKQKASLAINFNNMSHTLTFEDYVLNSIVDNLKRGVEEKINSISKENSHLVEEVRLKDKKLKDIAGELISKKGLYTSRNRF